MVFSDGGGPQQPFARVGSASVAREPANPRLTGASRCRGSLRRSTHRECDERAMPVRQETAPLGHPPRPSRARRRKQIVLARCWREKLTLDQLARAVFSTPFHLARVFRRETGLGLHQYQTNLRLRHALERLAEDVTADLTMLALELGFSSHAHFTAAFRRAFQVVPRGVGRKQSPALDEPVSLESAEDGITRRNQSPRRGGGPGRQN